jgi:hypothetical protein
MMSARRGRPPASCDGRAAPAPGARAARRCGAPCAPRPSQRAGGLPGACNGGRRGGDGRRHRAGRRPSGGGSAMGWGAGREGFQRGARPHSVATRAPGLTARRSGPQAPGAAWRCGQAGARGKAQGGRGVGRRVAAGPGAWGGARAADTPPPGAPLPWRGCARWRDMRAPPPAPPPAAPRRGRFGRRFAAAPRRRAAAPPPPRARLRHALTKPPAGASETSRRAGAANPAQTA